MKPAELLKLQGRDQVVLVDVRTPQAFAAGHLEGAINIPAADIETRAADLRRLAGTRRIVLYCSCAFEHTAADAAVRLARLGVTKVSVLLGGYRGEEAHDIHDRV
jgi:rhodanese-related sulfurtransferase